MNALAQRADREAPFGSCVCFFPVCTLMGTTVGQVWYWRSASTCREQRRHNLETLLPTATAVGTHCVHAASIPGTPEQSGDRQGPPRAQLLPSTPDPALRGPASPWATPLAR